MSAPRLGFGSASTPRGISSADYIRLVETAIDAGVRHLDTARMYGYGETEFVLGELVQRRRDDIVLVSKAGILPASTSLTARVARRSSALLSKFGLPLPGSVRALGEPQFGRFAPSEFIASVETSLRALKTDRLDALLLHECSPADVSDELLRTLEALKSEGKILAIGTATSPAHTAAIAAAPPGIFTIWQFPCSLWERTIDAISAPPGATIITHSVLGDRFHALCQRIDADPEFRASMSAALDLDAGDRAALAGLFLAEALATNASGVVLFYSSSAENIGRNARTAAALEAGLPRVERLRAFMAASHAAP